MTCRVTSRRTTRASGVDAIWLRPIAGGDNGYDISDYQAIELCFGTMEDFDHMLAEAHARAFAGWTLVNHTEMHLVHRPLPATTRSAITSGATVKTAAPRTTGLQILLSAWTLDETRAITPHLRHLPARSLGQPAGAEVFGR
ncbi:MAG: alpha-amylase family glycosyl hydrolase [Oscillospiraceae bacterium]